MTSRNLITLLFIGHFTNLFAQDPMVAYRKENVWHYFDTNGKSMWQPYADVAAFPGGWNKGLLKASAMDITGKNANDIAVVRQQVLYDNKGKIVFRPKVKSNYRIVSNQDKAGFFYLKDNENEHIILCNKAGDVVYESANTTAEYLGDGVVSYLKTDAEMDLESDKNYILYDVKTEKEMAQIPCLGLSGNFEDGSIFCYNKAGLYGMVNRQGTMTQPMIWKNDIFTTDNKATPHNGFFTLLNPQTDNITLFNKKGEIVLAGFSEVVALTKYYLKLQYNVEHIQFYRSYIIDGTTITEIKEAEGNIAASTEGGIFACKNGEGEVKLIDNTLKTYAIFKDVKDVAAMQHTFWILTDKENIYTCYDEKGKTLGTLEAEEVGKLAYGHVPFKLNGKWGLAHESGKVVIKPRFEFNSENVPDVQNGYWGINISLPDDKYRFDFYNFQGKLVMSTTSEKEGWDYMVMQEEVDSYRNN
jgi:hypothetical protein